MNIINQILFFLFLGRCEKKEKKLDTEIYSKRIEPNHDLDFEREINLSHMHQRIPIKTNECLNKVHQLQIDVSSVFENEESTSINPMKGIYQEIISNSTEIEGKETGENNICENNLQHDEYYHLHNESVKDLYKFVI